MLNIPAAKSFDYAFLFKRQRHACRCFLIKVQSSILRVEAIKRKD